ncbi:hypothetical protein H0H93_004558 [Arthromyces matolae]|nr:hypothetical protein H0H93_004558 [Arthromyces matolae]
MPRTSHKLSVTLPNYGALVFSRIYGKLEGVVSVSDVERERTGEAGPLSLKGTLTMKSSDRTDPIQVLLKVANDVDLIAALKSEALYMSDKLSSNSGVARHHGFYVHESPRYLLGCSILDYHSDVVGESFNDMEDEDFRWVEPSITFSHRLLMFPNSKQIVPLVVGLHQTHNLDLEYVRPFGIRMQNRQPILIECVKLKNHNCAYTEDIEASRGTLRPLFSEFPSMIDWYGWTIKANTITSPSFLYELPHKPSYVASIPGEQRWAHAVETWKEIASSWKSYHPEAQSPPTDVELDYKKYIAIRYPQPWYTRWEVLSGLLSVLLVFALVIYGFNTLN